MVLGSKGLLFKIQGTKDWFTMQEQKMDTKTHTFKHSFITASISEVNAQKDKSLLHSKPGAHLSPGCCSVRVRIDLDFI